MRRRDFAGVISQGGVQGADEAEKGKDVELQPQMIERWLLLLCVLFRCANALAVRTYFNPDEYWQSLEVAHRLVFGYGHLTWEWREGLRGYLHPLIFAGLYKMLALLHLDTPKAMWVAPRLLQAFFAAFGDFYLYKLARRFFSPAVAAWALFCQLSSWFTFYCLVRTFSNSLETVLTTMALYYWPWGPRQLSKAGSLSARQVALLLAGAACVIRPTSAATWLLLGLQHLREGKDRGRFFWGEVLPIGCLMLGVSTLVDSYMYGQLTLVPLNFLRFNLGGQAVMYGAHPWHWYWTQGFPTLMTTFLPLAALGLWESKEQQPALLIGWTLSLYSFLGHKEFRFVLPMLPLALMYSGFGIGRWTAQQGPANSRGRKVVALVLLTQLPMAVYFSLVHQRGSVAVMEHLAEEAVNGRVTSVGFLMPCHSTPYYAYLHAPIPLRFLDCSPSGEPGYVDEAERFFKDPEGFLASEWKASLSGKSRASGSEGVCSSQRSFSGVERPPGELPSHLVLFSSLQPRIEGYLRREGYKEVKRFMHQHAPVDRELQSYVLLFARKALAGVGDGH